MKLIICLLVVCLQCIFSEVTVLRTVQTIYDRSPKLRIRGSGFDVDEHSIVLELSAQGQPSLRADKDYLLTKDDDGIILKLLSARRYIYILNYFYKYILFNFLNYFFKIIIIDGLI
jgi:hypothetical protein